MSYWRSNANSERHSPYRMQSKFLKIHWAAFWSQNKIKSDYLSLTKIQNIFLMLTGFLLSKNSLSVYFKLSFGNSRPYLLQSGTSITWAVYKFKCWNLGLICLKIQTKQVNHLRFNQSLKTIRMKVWENLIRPVITYTSCISVRFVVWCWVRIFDKSSRRAKLKISILDSRLCSLAKTVLTKPWINKVWLGQDYHWQNLSPRVCSLAKWIP